LRQRKSDMGDAGAAKAKAEKMLKSKECPGWFPDEMLLEFPELLDSIKQPKLPGKKTLPTTILAERDPGDEWPRLDEAAFHGLAGEIAETIDPHSEADPVAVLLHNLVMFGNAIGRGPYIRAGGGKHFTNLYCVIAGSTARGKKGTAANFVERVFEVAWPAWMKRIKTSISTGQGIVKLIRDPDEKEAAELIKAGLKPEKRVLFLVSELGGLFTAMRNGNRIVEDLNNAWDGKRLENNVKKDPMFSTDPMVSVIGHATPERLVQSLGKLEATTGFSNRFIYARVRQSKRIPRDTLKPEVIEEMAKHLKEAILFAREVEEVGITARAEAYWTGTLLDEIENIPPDTLGAMLARGRPLVLRLALIYALLDLNNEIDTPHLLAAFAIWKFNQTCVEQLFADKLESPKANKILVKLDMAGEAGISRSGINDLFKGKTPAFELNEVLTNLERKGKIRSEKKVTAGRTADWFYLVSQREQGGKGKG
jgi:hypothetical protein